MLCVVSAVCCVYCVLWVVCAVCCEWCVLWVVCAVSGVCCVWCVWYVLCVVCVVSAVCVLCTCVDRGWTVSALTFHNKTAAGKALELSYTVPVFRRYSFISCSYITCSHKLFSSDYTANYTKLTAVRGSCPESRHSCLPSLSFLRGAVQNTLSSNYDVTSPINNDTPL